jgi:hypothetical protein
MGLVEKVQKAACALALAGSAAYIGWAGIGRPLLTNSSRPPYEIVNELRKQRGKSLGSAVLSPDGRRIALHGYGEKGGPNVEIYVYDIETKSLENITQSETREVDPVWISDDVVKYLRAEDFREYWQNIRTGERGKVLSYELSGLAVAVSLFATPFAFLLGYAALRRRRRRPLIEPLIDEPGTAFRIGFVGTAAGLALTEPIRAAYPEVNATVQPLYFAAAAAIPYACALYTNMFACVNPPLIRNFLKERALLFKKINKPYEVRIKLCDELSAVVRHPAQVDMMRAEIALQHGYADEGLRWMRKALEKVDDLVEWKSATLPVIAPFADAYFKYLSWRARSPLTHLSRANIALKRLNFSRMRRQIEEFARRSGGPDAYAARAVFLQSVIDSWHKFQALSLSRAQSWEAELAAESTSLERIADSAWQDAIGRILAQPDLEAQFRPMGESRNEVLEYAANQFLKQLLVFKRCGIKDRQRLIDERENMQYFRRYLGNKVVKSLAYVEHEGKAYHITLHGSGRTLERAIQGDSEGKEVALKSAAEILARIHTIELGSAADPAKSARYYSDRLLQTFYNPLKAAGAAMPENLSALLQQFGIRVHSALEGAVMGAYKDANPRNWLIDDDGFAVAIDFEHRQRLPVHLDVVSAMEFGPAVVVDDASLEYFLNAGAGRLSRPAGTFLNTHLAQIMMSDEEDRLEFLEHYRWAALQRHMEFAGYRMRDSELPAVEFHIGRARKYAYALGDTELGDALGQIRLRGAAP